MASTLRLALALVLFTSPVLAQSEDEERGAVVGRVVDAAGRPAPGVQVAWCPSVLLWGTEWSFYESVAVRTDAAGRYELLAVPWWADAVVVDDHGVRAVGPIRVTPGEQTEARDVTVAASPVVRLPR